MEADEPVSWGSGMPDDVPSRSSTSSGSLWVVAEVRKFVDGEENDRKKDDEEVKACVGGGAVPQNSARTSLLTARSSSCDRQLWMVAKAMNVGVTVLRRCGSKRIKEWPAWPKLWRW